MQTIVSPSKKLGKKPRILSITRYARWWMTSLLVLSDAFFLALSLGGALVARHIWLGGVGDLTLYGRAMPFMAAFFVLAAWQGLYRGGGNSPVRELQLLSESVSITFLLVMAFTFFTQTGTRYSRFVFLGGWGISLVALPMGRWGMRLLAGKLGWWGEPLAVLGDGTMGQQVVAYLLQRSGLGLCPVVLLTDEDSSARRASNVPLLRFASPDDVLRYLREHHLETLVVIPAETPDDWIQRIINASDSHIRRILFISDLGKLSGVDVRSYDLNGMLGLELRQNLLSLPGQLTKRGIDLFLAIVSSCIVLPASLFIAVLIKLDSPGPVIYKQSRVGRRGKLFDVWKFRTMVENADEILQTYLQQYPEMRREWEATQKLKEDPRVTRVGRLLRKFSLDELPQLVNVLRGEMSLVGPRPCMPQQVELYGHVFELYKRVRPGITGLWQVSGRNDTTYAERVRLDEYYVRNWSIWLDIYILARTVWVVLKREGAY